MKIITATVPEHPLIYVNSIKDWAKVRGELVRKALAEPLNKEQAYSATESEAFAKAKKLVDDGLAGTVMKYSAVVVYKKRSLISLVLTSGPKGLHLSMAEVLQGGDLKAVPDFIANEAALAILGIIDEHFEGVMTAVRHFFALIT